MDTGSSLHGSRIFFQLRSGGSTISHCRYYLAQIFLAHITGCINSLAAGLPALIGYHISMGIQIYQFFYQ